MDRIPKPGEFYRHFKNRMYQVLQVATHTETGERLVIYQALYGDYGVYARPFEQFTGLVDHDKYPEAKQKYRFEQVFFESEEKTGGTAGEAANRLKACEAQPNTREAQPEERTLSPLVLEFLDAQTYEDKLFILQRMKGQVDQCDLDSLYLIFDLTPIRETDGTQEEQLEGLKQYIRMRQHYDASRLRRR